MTLEEKIALMAGVDDWHFHGVPRLGIPSVMVTDCGHGVTLCGVESSPATCFPTGIGMASTWNAELLERAGAVIGRETRALGCSILLGPKINLHRHPLNGRSFETFSEDPWLAGLLGAAVIRGIQSQGVGACVKAVAANNQQQDQQVVSSEVAERPLRELYLRAFQLAVEEGNPCAVMTAYNRLNGDFCSESAWMIRQVIKGEWAYPGFILSDWRSVHTAQVYGSGLDLEMPGPGKLYNAQMVRHALEEGLLTEAEVDDKALRVLRAILRYGAAPVRAEEGNLDTPANRRAALEVAEESIVLLKNEGAVLPLDRKSLRRLLVVGPNAAVARLGGGGSASVTPFYSVSPLEGIREACGSEVEVQYLEGCNLVGTMETIHDVFTHVDAAGKLRSGLRGEFFNARDPRERADYASATPQVDFSWGWAAPGPGIARGIYSVRFSGILTAPVSGTYRLGVFAQEGCVSLTLDGHRLVEDWDNDPQGNFEASYQTRYFTIEREFTAGQACRLELCYGKRAARAGVRLEWEIPGQADPISRAADLAREADAVIVCAGLCNMFEGGTHDRPDIDLPEAQVRLIQEIAAANPRTIVTLNSGGVLGLDWEACVPAILQAWYPGQEGGRALAHILFGQVNPSGRLPDTIPFRLEDHAAIQNYPGDGREVRYKEGLSIGYRHFDRAGIPVRYPFGHGLSYTTFELFALTAEPVRPGHQVTVRARVKNTGPGPGKTVVQLYIRAVAPPLERPEKELRAFRKIHLDPGHEREISFTLGRRDWEYFDPAQAAWTVAPGQFEVLVGVDPSALQKVTISL
jgi:beta-glucosidase